MFTLLRKLFWIALFLICTVGFVTLFDHGYVSNQQFTTDAKSEVHDFMQLVHPIKRPKDTSDDLAK
jgi:hypothetical protein